LPPRRRLLLLSERRHLALIQRSAWNRNSANFALTEFSEVRVADVWYRGPQGSEGSAPKPQCSRAARRRPTLFETSYPRSWPQPKLFGLDALGEDGWLKVLKLDEYAPRRPRGSLALQQVLFAYKEAI
jgi:hypothetical protein